MALSKKCGKVKSKPGTVVNGEVTGLGFGCVRCTRGLGRKRVGIANSIEDSSPESPIRGQLKRQRSGILVSGSSLESMPEDVLVRIICGVDHEDLVRLSIVSKSIREAAMIAKKCHFAYSTPKKTLAFRNPAVISESSDLDEMEPPNAPRQKRYSNSRIDGKDFSSISMVLFA